MSARGPIQDVLRTQAKWLTTRPDPRHQSAELAPRGRDWGSMAGWMTEAADLIDSLLDPENKLFLRQYAAHVDALFAVIERMGSLSPDWRDLTWMASLLGTVAHAVGAYVNRATTAAGVAIAGTQVTPPTGSDSGTVDAAARLIDAAVTEDVDKIEVAVLSVPPDDLIEVLVALLDFVVTLGPQIDKALGHVTPPIGADPRLN